jgi:chaperonin GroES
MKELQPVNQNVILQIEKEAKEQRTASGIIIPDTVQKEKPTFGKVIALSNIEGPEITVGDTVMFRQFSGTEVELEGEDFLIIPYADVMAKIVETESI